MICHADCKETRCKDSVKNTEQEQLSTTVNFADLTTGELAGKDDLFMQFRAEYNRMQIRYIQDHARQGQGVGRLSDLQSEEIFALLCDFVSGKERRGNIDGREISDLLRLAIKDLIACYLAGFSTQKNTSIDVSELYDWFWGQTLAARVISEVRNVCMKHPRDDVRFLGIAQLIPLNQMYRFTHSCGGDE